MKKIFLLMLAGLIISGGAVHALADGQDISLSLRMAAGAHHAVAVLADGRVAAAGENEDGQCNVQNWENIIQVAAGEAHTVGLKADGTVIAAGRNDQGQCDVDEWRDIAFIACGDEHTVGLRKDGTVVACGIWDYVPGYMNPPVNPCAVNSWRDVVLLAAGGHTTFAVDKNGIVLVAGELEGEPLEWINEERNAEGQPLMMYKTLDEIPRQIAVVGRDMLLYLYDDGTVDYDGLSLRLYPEEWGMCADCNPGIDRWSDFGTHTATLWTDIVELYTSDRFVIGLKNNGEVVVAGSEVTVDAGGVNIHAVEEWKNIVSLAVGHDFAIGVDFFGKMHYQAQPDGDLSGVKLWENMDFVAASQGTAVGRDMNGEIYAWSAVEDLMRFGDNRTGCEFWKDIRFLTVGDDLAAGIDGEGKILLAGYHDYTEENLTAASAMGPAEKLAVFGERVLVLTEAGRVYFLDEQDMGWDLASLTGAKDIAFQGDYILALMPDGRVKAVSYQDSLWYLRAPGECGSLFSEEIPGTNTGHWENIIAIAVGGDVSYGLTAEGKVLIAGETEYGQDAALSWENIIAISASPYHVAGLKADGTVIAAGLNEELYLEDDGEQGTKNQCEVNHWQNVKQVIAAVGGTIGVCHDGSMLYAGADYADVSDCLSWQLFEGTHERQDAPLRAVSARLLVIEQRKAINALYVRQTLEYLKRENGQSSAIIQMHPEYDQVYAFHNGYAMVKKDGLYGLVNEEGKEILPPIYDFMNRSNNATVYADASDWLYGFFMEDTGVLVSPAFGAAQDFEGEYVNVMLPDESEMYMDRQGNLITEKAYKALRLPEYQPEKSSLSLYIVDDYWESFEGAYGYTDTEGNILIDPIFQLAYEFEDGLARVNLWGYEGYINEQGEIVCGFEGLEERLTEN